MKSYQKTLITIVYCLISSSSFSQDFFDIDTDNINYAPSANWSNVEKGIVEDMLKDFEKEGNKSIESIDTGNFLNATANAQGLTHSLLGADYANDFRYFLFGGNVSTAIDLGGESVFNAISGDLDGDSFKGFSAGASMILGMNLNERTQVFLNGFKLQASESDFTFNSTSLGVRVRYHLFGHIQRKYKNNRKPSSQDKKFKDKSSEENFIESEEDKNTKEKARVKATYNKAKTALLRWGGIKAHTGLQFSNLNLGYSKQLSLSDQVDQAGITVRGSLDTTVKAEISSKTLSIPLEVSTYADLLYFLTPYAGLGVNINTGSSSGNARLEDTVIRAEKTGGLGTGTATTTANVNFEEKSKPRFVDPKMFLGLQLNLWKLKVGFQYDKSLGGDAEALSTTFRLSF